MRFYEISITDPDTAEPYRDAAGKPIGPFSSHDAMGRNKPGALQVEFEIPEYAADALTASTFLKIWGIGLQGLGGSSNFNPRPKTKTLPSKLGASVEMRIGMKGGLPLSKGQPMPAIVLRSSVLQAFGNWQGRNQSLDFLINGPYGGPEEYESGSNSPVNLVFNWSDGQPLGDAISLALSGAFEGIITTAIGNNPLPPNGPQHAFFQSLGQFAKFVYKLSKSLGPDPSYLGIRIIPTANPQGFRVFDGADFSPTESRSVALKFTDLIGQPTWLSIATVSFKTMMRGDIKVGDVVTLPNGVFTTSEQSQAAYRSALVLNGPFLITSIRHIGNYKQPSADSWVSVYGASSVATIPDT